jgi:chromate reductase
MADLKPKLLAISGSLRKASLNTAILTTLAESVADRAVVTLFPLNDIPGYDGDLDSATPPDAVSKLRSAIAHSDGVVIGSPEYNYGISGVLKNALDWASRPFGKSTLTGKPVLTLTASPAFTGGVRAQSQLNDLLMAIAAQVVLRPQAVVGLAHEKVKEGRLIDTPTLQFLSAGVDALIQNIRRSGATIKQEA